MGAVRAMVQDGGLARNSRAGDNTMTGFNPLIVSADANATLTVEAVAGGLIQYTGFTAGRNLTTDTAANYIAANPWMDIGDSFAVEVSIVPAFAGTLVAGTGVTLAGKTTVVASGRALLVFTRTAAATMTCRVC